MYSSGDAHVNKIHIYSSGDAHVERSGYTHRQNWVNMYIDYIFYHYLSFVPLLLFISNLQ